MRRSTTLLGSLAVAAAMIGATALPASAATIPGPGSTGTITTFDLDGGVLSLTTADAGALDNLATTGQTAITGNLGTVTVDDERGGTVAWSVSASSTAFTGALVTAPSSSTAVSYTAGAVAETGTITVADGTVQAISTETPVVVPTSLSGNNTASWDPLLSVTMPAGAKADTYTGTVTTSIA